MTRHLLFRCARCRATTSAQISSRQGPLAQVACVQCGATYSLRPDLHNSLSDEDYIARVRAYARAQNIDVASACSVLEGIMRRENVRPLRPAAAEGPAPARVPGASAFRGAGFMVFLFVFSAFFAGRAVGGRGAAATPGSAAAPATMSAGPALPPLLPAGRSGWIVCQLDANQTVTKLSGPDARTVLEAFLDQPAYGGNLIPYGVAPASGSGLESKIGVARDRFDPSHMVSVRLWGDRQGRWAVGDGRGAVHLEPITVPPEGFEPF